MGWLIPKRKCEEKSWNNFLDNLYLYTDRAKTPPMICCKEGRNWNAGEDPLAFITKATKTTSTAA